MLGRYSTESNTWLWCHLKGRWVSTDFHQWNFSGMFAEKRDQRVIWGTLRDSTNVPC